MTRQAKPQEPEAPAVAARSTAMRLYDVVVIGAGAGGMMCAAQAGQRGRRTLLIEHHHVLGEKVRISGGGRCNFTNTGAGPANYLSQNPDFARSALARCRPAHFLRLVESHGIAWHEKKLGQLVHDDTAVDIIRMLKAECDRGHVEWRMPCGVDGVTRAGDHFVVATPQGAVRCTSLVIATGGLTVPKIGATPFGYRIAEQFGLRVIAPRPALVPLAFAPDALERHGDLSGVSVDAETTCNGGRFRENLLFTHRGLSGPAILQISSYWDGRALLQIDLLPGFDAHAWLAAHSAAMPLHELGRDRLREIAARLHRWEVLPSGTLGYNKAEVTLGGMDTGDLSSKTMAATAVPGLYFIGEVVDVTGWLGGSNFQWAWASGHAA